MNILYIHQYFKTPSQPGGTRSYWISQELLKNGHQITMITSDTDPKAAKKRREVYIDGIRVIYLKVAYNQNMPIIKRLKSFIRFIIKSSNESFKVKNVDMVIATSTPLTIGISALLLKWFKGKKYIFEVRDLWPEVPVQMGAIKNPLIIKAARFFEKIIYKNAAHVVALSPGMQNGVINYIPKSKTSMIPNMAKKDEFWPREKNREMEKNLGLKPNSFKIIHFGALGIANGAETILKSAMLLKNDDSVEFLFVGEGATEVQLKEICNKNDLKNVKFLGKFAMKDVSEIVNLSDISIVSFKDLPILYTNSPNKFFDSLSAGKPIIVNSAGWTKDIVEKYQNGFYVNPAISNELVEKIKYLQMNPDIVHQMGINSRKLAENQFDKSILSKQFVEVVEKISKN